MLLLFNLVCKVNNTLLVLKMTGNPIGCQGGLRIAQALQINKTLQFLDLGECDQVMNRLVCSLFVVLFVTFAAIAYGPASWTSLLVVVSMKHDGDFDTRSWLYRGLMSDKIIGTKFSRYVMLVKLVRWIL